MKIIDKDIFASECTFKTSRSGGKGGQNVNKVETKVELSFNILGTGLFTDDEKGVLLQKLASSIRDERFYYTTCDEDRSQLRNKERAVNKAIRAFLKALVPVKERRATKPSKASKIKRLTEKKVNAERKENRRRISDF